MEPNRSIIIKSLTETGKTALNECFKKYDNKVARFALRRAGIKFSIQYADENDKPVILRFEWLLKQLGIMKHFNKKFDAQLDANLKKHQGDIELDLKGYGAAVDVDYTIYIERPETPGLEPDKIPDIEPDKEKIQELEKKLIPKKSEPVDLGIDYVGGKDES